MKIEELNARILAALHGVIGQTMQERRVAMAVVYAEFDNARLPVADAAEFLAMVHGISPGWLKANTAKEIQGAAKSYGEAQYKMGLPTGTPMFIASVFRLNPGLLSFDLADIELAPHYPHRERNAGQGKSLHVDHGVSEQYLRHTPAETFGETLKAFRSAVKPATAAYEVRFQFAHKGCASVEFYDDAGKIGIASAAWDGVGMDNAKSARIVLPGRYTVKRVECSHGAHVEVREL